MTKQTYRKHLNNYLDRVIRKFGYEHPATVRFAKTHEAFYKADPTEQHDSIVRHLMYFTLKHGEEC